MNSPKKARNNHLVDTAAPKFTQIYLTIIAIITFGLGVGLLVFPSWIAGLFFNSPGIPTYFFVKMIGSTLVGYAALNALAAHDATHRTCKVAVWSNLVTLLIASAVTLSYQNVFNNFGWLIISQHIFFATGFMYCAWQLAHQTI